MSDPIQYLGQQFDKTLQVRTENTNERDRILYTAITGVLAVSVTILFGFKETLVFPYLLLTSWIFLCGSLLFHYHGYRLAIKQSNKVLDEINLRIGRISQGEKIPEGYNPFQFTKGASELELSIERAERICIFLFILGALFVFFFAATNLRQIETHNTLHQGYGISAF